MARIITGKKKSVVSSPDSISKKGKKIPKTASKRKSPRKAGGDDLISISIHEKVMLLAYRYWEERGRPGGSPEEDWYRAEREVLDQASRGNS